MRISLAIVATWRQVALVEVVFHYFGQPLLFVCLSDPLNIAASFVILGNHLLVRVKDEGQSVVSRD